MNTSADVVVQRNAIGETNIDLGNRDIVVGIGEPAFRSSLKHPDIRHPAYLNARLPAYLLPAVQIAAQQKRRPRLLIVSGINFATRWNAQNDYERAIMLINNQLKMDYFQMFIEQFWPETFSLVERVVSQDILKIPEHKLVALWTLLERRFPEESAHIQDTLMRFARGAEHDDSIERAIAYAVAHIFATGDVNFEGNYVHPKTGYASIGGDRETIFNNVRAMLMPLVQDFADILFDRPTIVMDNMRIVVEAKEKVPPPYNGFYKENGSGTLELSEVTYENGRPLKFYEEHPRLREDSEYIYALCGKDAYGSFWDSYRSTYEKRKARFEEAYGVSFPTL